MKTLKFKTDSWHYKIVNYIENGKIENKINICSYRWLVAKALTIGLVFGSVCMALVQLALFLIIDTLFMLFVQDFLFSRSTATFGIMLSVCGLLYLSWRFVFFPIIAYSGEKIGKTTGRIKRKIKRKNKDKPDNFFVQAYKSLKDKYCVQVEFIE